MSSQTAESVTVIEPTTRVRLPRPRELWQSRDLLFELARRDVTIRYKQSAVGVLWAVLQPTLLAVVFSVFLGQLADVPSGNGVPYPVFAVSGMVMWLFFANSMSSISQSTVGNSQLISKVYFPRILIPLAAVVPATFDLVISLLVVFGAMAIYGIAPSPEAFLLPFAIFLVIGVALGAGLWLSALHVRYRDVQVLVPFVIQVGLFITPVVYPFELVPDALQPIYALNPMVGVLELYRWMLFASDWPGAVVLIPLVVSVVLLTTGALFFQRAERSFADVI